MPTPPDKLRTLLSQGRILTVPACFDAYSAHLAERAGFPATFMSGFSVAATRLALPDTGLISYGEIVDQGRRICLLVARTDARHEHGLGEAIARAQAFAELGAEILFVEAPKSEEELAVVGREVPGWKFANLVEGGETPVLPHKRLEELGFSMAVYAATLLSAATRAMTTALEALASDTDRGPLLTDFEILSTR